MASLRRTLANRLPRIAKTPSSSSSSSSIAAVANAPASATPSESLLRRSLSSGDRSISFFQKRPTFQPALPPDRPSLPAGDLLAERIRALNTPRIRLDGLLPPPAAEPESARATAEEMRKVAWAAQMEAARAALRATPGRCVSYAEFLRVCRAVADGYRESEIARALDESGSVIVLGDAVILRPEELVRAMETVISSISNQQNDPRREELRKLEEEKAAIDRRADIQVRRELWCGLGYLVVQTAAFMRLTFWELSWDVMEPICFYVASIYFLAGYAFFLMTAKEPSFEGFLQSRFATKQKRLMRAQGFDIHRFNELKQAYSASPAVPSLPYRSRFAREVIIPI